MLFNSIEFLIFFPIVLLLYYTVAPKHRWILLLIASYYFYMRWNPAYVLLILLATAINFFAALQIDNHRENKAKSRFYLAIGMITSLGILFVFKYANFVGSMINDLFGLLSVDRHISPMDILLPVGISFYTFQAMSYTIDVYQGTTKAEKSFGYFALFVSFFPQLVAGPIEKSENLLPQLHQEHPFTYENATYGLKLMAVGFFKKVVVADNLAAFVNKVYNAPESYAGGIWVLATFFFAFQIYCDFSGYSDIARGCAKMMGIDLMRNFRSPYLAGSIKDFWRRWHISLSSWFRDYVYIPLGGSRRILPVVCMNIMITFTLSGIWHGANYTFIAWGALHGIYLVIQNIWSHYHKPSPAFRKGPARALKVFLSSLITFCLVCIAWIFFRANSMADALYVLKSMFVGIASPVAYLKETYQSSVVAIGIPLQLYLLLGYVAVLFGIDLLDNKKDIVARVSALPLVVRWTIYVLFTLLIILCMPKNAPAEFIYFQF